MPGASIVGEQWLTARTLHLDVATPSFSTATTPVEVTLPVGYAAQPGRRWPVMYYLAGTNHDETTFRADYHGEALTEDFPAIVVSPDGQAGYWSDWFNDGAGGPPMYTTFVTRQLIPLIDANFRTLAGRAHRAVVGESMGGFGAMSLAAQRPDLFVAAASLSGAVDTNFPTVIPVVTASPVLQGGLPDAIFGPRLTEEVVWRGHNPVDLAENLRGVDLQLFTGNGVFSPANGETAPELSGCALEGAGIEPMSIDLHQRLLDLGIAHRWTQLDWGCHSVALFDHELTDALEHLQCVFAAPPPPPSSFDHRSIAPTWTVWNWTVTADPLRAPEFLELRHADRAGVTVAGSGLTTVTTPPLFAGRASVPVTIDGSRRLVTPSSTGRLTFGVDLGPADLQQQYSVGAGTTVTTATVSFG
ncbi:MAG: alpha/beta hydrolase [Jatrophihabitans sp.]|uniref:alpha/beta hydrolase n=1 Tax=Jatrophihabitans sp. TaxID=1932789 RepID=UPI003F7DA45A